MLNIIASVEGPTKELGQVVAGTLNSVFKARRVFSMGSEVAAMQTQNLIFVAAKDESALPPLNDKVVSIDAGEPFRDDFAPFEWVQAKYFLRRLL